MVDAVNPLGSEIVRPSRIEIDPQQMRSAPTTGAAPATSFKQVLAETIGEAQRLQTEADMTIRQVVSGQIKDVTEAVVAVEKADVSFQSMMAVRNKIVDAYQEIMRMQV